ncbi:hypothetical protein DD237_001347 [Peronospora effusa]|uniref:Pectinesterase n=1 Tax=Peronospora effusa TaxID=542832 RepID=A0A3R7XYZ8_9STRA|nr:hypothetical protein DD237_001347 [Peronospora effusa]
MRMFALPVILLASLVVGADAACTNPPAGAIIVDQSGHHSGYLTIKDAVNNLDLSTTVQQTIFIYKGTYQEQVVISKLKGTLVLQGYTCDKMSYDKNEVTITHQMSQQDLSPHHSGSANDLVSTLRIDTDNVQVYNLNFVNTAVPTPQNGQAPALSVACKQCAFYVCTITGHQDTLFANRGYQFYGRSHVVGTVDFIFGNARAWFQSCDIESVGPGYITANGRGSEDDNSYFVLNKARVSSLSPGKVYLGRPWGKYARVVFQQCDLGGNINAAGWIPMYEDMGTSNVFLKEYKDANTTIDGRVPYSGQLDGPIAISTILGKDFATFVNKDYL